MISAGNAAVRYAVDYSSNGLLEIQWYMFAGIVLLTVLVWGGAGILGWVAGEIFADDTFIEYSLGNFNPDQLELIADIIGARIVLISGYFWRRAHHMALEEN